MIYIVKRFLFFSSSFICYLVFSTLLIAPFYIRGQEIRLANASFEGIPSDATMPQQWTACKRGSTPDIMPGFWGVYLEPFDGETYVGLITREDGSFESIGQKVRTPFKAQECYKFTIELAHSNTYANYSLPVRLRIWGGRTRCSKDQLLAESPSVKHLDWKTYQLQFMPEHDYPYIIIEAYYAKGIFFPYRGNLLMDNISVFKTCPRA